MSLARSTAVVTAGSAASRLLGFARDALLAHLLGAGPIADAFLAVFRIPTLVRRVLSEGGLNAGFVPQYLRLKAEAGSHAALRFSGEALSSFALMLLALVAVVELAAGAVVLVVAAGFVEEPRVHVLATLYLRAAFPFVLGASLAALVAALLNAERRVLAASLAPLAANAAVVVALLVLRTRPEMVPERQAAWLAAATGASGFVQLLVVAFAGRRADLRLAPPRLTPELRRLVVVAGPALAASAAAQLIVLAASAVASFTPSALSWLYYADRLFQLPLGFVAAAAGMVLLPEIAARHAAERHDGVLEAQNRALEAALLLGVPAAAALAALAPPIVTLLFERGAFGPQDSAGTAAALVGLAVGLPAAATGKVLSQTLFARHDLRTPVVAGVVGVLAAIAGAALLSRALGPLGLGLGAGFGFVVHAATLLPALRRAGLWPPDARLKANAVRALGASAVMAGALALAQPSLDVVLGPAPGTGLQALRLALLCFGGLALYGALAWRLGAIGGDGLRLGRG